MKITHKPLHAERELVGYIRGGNLILRTSEHTSIEKTKTYAISSGKVVCWNARPSEDEIAEAFLLPDDIPIYRGDTVVLEF